MVFRIVKRFEFCSSHRLIRSDLDEEKNYQLFGKCFNTPSHGHNYILEVTVESKELVNGMVMNFSTLKDIVNKRIIDVYDHQFLNDKMNCITTAENLCLLFYRNLKEDISNGMRIKKVRIWETSTSYAEYEVV